MDTKVLTAHVPLQLANKVDALAASIERPRGWVVKEALAAWVEQEERRHEMTLEALESVDAGRTVPHEDVLAWASRLGSKDIVSVPKARKR
ncbi:MAG TPA: ribbon-helix-helix domain-containing protein [Gammaproteobacteria bacterium]